jgi:hypothetical protein
MVSSVFWGITLHSHQYENLKSFNNDDDTQKQQYWGLDATSSGSSLMAAFTISGVELSGFATQCKLIYLLFVYHCSSDFRTAEMNTHAPVQSINYVHVYVVLTKISHVTRKITIHLTITPYR